MAFRSLIWFAVTAVFRLIDWTPLSAAALNVVVFGITIPLSWRYRTSGPPKKFLRTPYDIPLRAIAAAIVVAVVTTASYRIGSFASGMFAVFPIVMCSSIVILHPRVGGKATASMLAHAQIALVGLSLGFLAVHYTAVPLGSWWALRHRPLRLYRLVRNVDAGAAADEKARAKSYGFVASRALSA